MSPALIVSCSSGEPENRPLQNEGTGTGGVEGGDGDTVASGGLQGDGDVASTGGVPGGGGGPTSTGGAPVVGSGGGTGTGGDSGGNASGGAPVVSNCTDNLPTNTDWPEATCQMWKDDGQCEAQWFIDQGACEETCGRCSGGGSGGAPGDGDGDTGGTGSSGGTTGMGNPWGGVSGGQSGWTSRYWDCCKQSCAWSANAGGNPVNSCDASGSNVVSPDDQSACSGGSSTTCNSMAPWAYSDEVSFGFVATHAGSGTACGTCYHIEFTGSSHNGGADPGSAALSGKTMIVMATNIGGDVSGDGQLDLLLPGGGVGMYYGCGTAWGVQQGSNELGAQYGGLRSDCGGDHNSIKSCVADNCQSLFGSRGLSEMYDGCMWYANWFEAADNPNFRIEEISCPSELTSVAY